MSQTQTLEIMEIPVDKIRSSPHQPRLEFDLEELRGSIIQYGIRDPIKVRRVGDYWELIDGERRWRIAQQEGMKTVPCLVLEYTDEEADALSWRFNVERKDYSLEERAKHFKKHQDEGMSAVGIGNIHGYSNVQVSKLLSIFRLPEKYQNYMWAGEFAFQKFELLYEKGLLSTEGFKYLKDITRFIDESILSRLTQEEFENVVNKYLKNIDSKQLEEAKKAAVKAEVSQGRENRVTEAVGEPEVKPPETSEEFEEAAKALRGEAKRRKTPKQIHQENLENAQKALNRISFRDAERFGVDVRNYRERVAEIEDYVKDRPLEALKDIKALQGELNSEVNSAQKRFEEDERKRREAETEKRIEEEAKRRARELKEAEKRRIEENARKKAHAEIIANPDLIREVYRERDDRYKEATSGLEEEDRIKLVEKAIEGSWNFVEVQEVKTAIKDMEPRLRKSILEKDVHLTPKTIVTLKEKLPDTATATMVVAEIKARELNEEGAIKMIERVASGTQPQIDRIRNDAERVMEDLQNLLIEVKKIGLHQYMILGDVHWVDAENIFTQIELYMKWLKHKGWEKNLESPLTPEQRKQIDEARQRRLEKTE